MKDYQERGRQAPAAQYREVLREVALKRVEAGHRRGRAYALVGEDDCKFGWERSDEWSKPSRLSIR